jgi:flavin-dependent dehydrogenase
MLDVLIVGAGPAGSVAATVLARAGARVRIVDRATFPREKLCGDTINPGTLALLRRLQLADTFEARSLAIGGMTITGEGGVLVDESYPRALAGRSIARADLDWLLLQQAASAGAEVECGVAVRAALVRHDAVQPVVEGVATGCHGSTRVLPARVTIAADGRHSTLAFSLNLARHPQRPRRWAVGAHFADVAGGTWGPASAGPGTDLVTSASPAEAGPHVRGEMHIRRDRYIGIAPLPGGLTNVCVVVPFRAHAPRFDHPDLFVRRQIEREDMLRDRFASARLVRPPIVLGPLAVDAIGGSVDGLLFAGDAAGFVDPMTGDGLRFAVRGGELAAAAALRALEHGWCGVHDWLSHARRREFTGKQRFNRMIRSIVGSPGAITLASRAAMLMPFVVRALVREAGDCKLA